MALMIESISYFSLGFSCQSRFSIDTFTADDRRNPFDFNITTRRAVLEGISSNGKNFNHSLNDVEIYEMPFEKRQGVESKGVYFWHDYPANSDGVLASEWASHVDRINQKYLFLWERFLRRIRLPGKKVFLLSNTQINLSEFSENEDDFAYKFRLDSQFFRDLCEVLDSCEVREYDIFFLVRDIEDAISLRRDISDPKLRVRFGGVMALPANSRIAHFSILKANQDYTRLSEIVGSYSNGTIIEYRGGDTAVAWRTTPSAGLEPWAEIGLLPDGYLFVFKGVNAIFTAALDGNRLRFSNGTSWTRNAG